MTTLKKWASQHPRLTAWCALAIGMVIILLWSAKDVGLLPTQLAALVVATIILAGLCVWIIGWEDQDEPTTDREGEKQPGAD
jgi:peptidoglycan/LPS O-acetylase OafA/YrhL